MNKGQGVKYDRLGRHKYHPHSWAINSVRGGDRILDLGCSTGKVARELTKKGCSVVGIESNKEAAKKARKYCERVIIEDLDLIEKFDFTKKFDSILALDVLEHLKNPERVLRILRPFLKKGGTLYASIPNICHWRVRLKLLAGKFEYEKIGILDESHLRFYNLEGARKLLIRSGFRIMEEDYNPGYAYAPIYFLTKLFPNLMALQFKFKAKRK